MLAGRIALVTGASRGIGQAIALRLAGDGATVAVHYHSAESAARAVVDEIVAAGGAAFALQADLSARSGAAALAASFTAELTERYGKTAFDILVNNAAHQATFKDIADISDEEWQRTFETNIHAMFYLTKAAVPHMRPGAAIINTASVNSDMPNPSLLAYATTKGAIQNFTGGLAQMLAGKGIRVNAVAPGPIWTPLIPSTMEAEKVAHFGEQVPMKRPGQPAELATAYVMLADPLSSYVSGATIAVTGGGPML
jgi:NAD(P)-dependent dehydrogenase (short-subunit alcohol dehydrogenase family)